MHRFTTLLLSSLLLSAALLAPAAPPAAQADGIAPPAPQTVNYCINNPQACINRAP